MRFAYIPIAMMLGLTACQFGPVATGPTKETNVHVDLANTERANVELDMAAGEMNVRGGANELVEGRFEFNVPAWEPKVDTSRNGSHAVVKIEQPHGVRMGGHTRYLWELQLNDKVLLDLAVNCGAGQARLNLGDLALRSVQVHMGAGQVDLDLRGQPTRDYDVDISGGVGQANVHLPEGVGVWAEAHGGIGSVTVTGLDKKDSHWENSLYNKGKVNVRIKVNGGIGEIRIMG
jgi:hypothetical protein